MWHEEADQIEHVGDVAKAASEGFHVKDEPSLFILMPFATEQVDGALGILDGGADGIKLGEGGAKRICSGLFFCMFG